MANLVTLYSQKCQKTNPLAWKNITIRSSSLVGDYVPLSQNPQCCLPPWSVTQLLGVLLSLGSRLRKRRQISIHLLPHVQTRVSSLPFEHKKQLVLFFFFFCSPRLLLIRREGFEKRSIQDHSSELFRFSLRSWMLARCFFTHSSFKFLENEWAGITGEDEVSGLLPGQKIFQKQDCPSCDHWDVWNFGW